MLKKLLSVKHKFRQYRSRHLVHHELNALLDCAHTFQSLEDRLDWLNNLLGWIRHEGPSKTNTRLRFLFLLLDKNIHWKKDTAVILRAIASEVSGLELYTETGLPQELGLWSELSDRIIMKVLPTPPIDYKLVYLFSALFPNNDDSIWIAAIDEDLSAKIAELLKFEIQAAESNWNHIEHDMEDALSYLAIQVQAIGLVPALRNRAGKHKIQSSAFFTLPQSIDNFILAYKSTNRDSIFRELTILKVNITDCRNDLDLVHAHLQEFGVSLNLVFQMMRLHSFLGRIENLLEVLLKIDSSNKEVVAFFSKLIKENQDLRSISFLFSQNIALLAQKIVERAAETGDHYIARTPREYKKMLFSASGGGALTAFTVYLKVGILSLGLSGFIEGLFATLNYSLSFVAIQLCGFTLGTKQPAMTAPAIAEKIRVSKDNNDDLITEIVCLIRSQMASILGNVLLVVPTAIIIDFIYYSLSGAHIFTSSKAQYALKSVDIFGPTIIYACFTGILLWLSSVASGWGDNLFALYSLRSTLARSPLLRFVFGVEGSKKIAAFFERNFAGIIGSLFLGVLLGMVPEVLKFVGLPLDVRHVTLSSGTLAGAFSALDINTIESWAFVRALVGILAIGLCNVGVSFGMALFVAMKARDIKPLQRRTIQKAILRRFISNPLSFFLPVGKSASK